MLGGETRENTTESEVLGKKRRSVRKAKVMKWQGERQRRRGELDERCEAAGKLKVEAGRAHEAERCRLLRVKVRRVEGQSSQGGKLQGPQELKPGGLSGGRFPLFNKWQFFNFFF